MNRFFKTALCSGVALAAVAASVPSIAQEITSSIRGTVTTPAGNPAAGYTVVVTDTRTGARQSTTTNASGNFSVRSLTVGGPYTVRVTGGQYEDFLITDIMTSLGNTANFNVALSEAQSNIEEIVVVASAASVTNLAIGPGTAFNLTEIESVPSVSRQIRDVIRIDPRVNIGRGSGGQGFGISCLGGSNRVNSFTIDGIRAADPFGLNSSGNLSRNTFPIPFDTVSATSVEFSPVDVEYGQFTGCNINVVTKSGTNEFTGSAFMLYTGDQFTGEDIEGQNPVTADFNNYNWGAEIGGPIIEDTLFFYGAYEETSTAAVQDEGPIGGGFLNESGVTVAEAERIRNILTNSYGRDPGDIVTTLPQTSRRFFGRVDWQINDQHRLAASYARLEENQLLGDDISGGRGEFTFRDNFQDRGSISDTYSLRLFSNWTDNFSTEVRLSRNTIGDIQNPTLGGEAQETNIPRIAIGPLSFSNEFFGQDFASGPGVFRSANQLDTEIDQIKFKADYVTGDHTLTFGYELDHLDVFNLFIINATGTILFDDIDALEAGTARRIRANSSFSGNPNDAAAEFSRNIHTLYIQDEWQVTDTFNLVGGLRYDFYKSGDEPLLNPVFQSRFGFSNQQAFDGLSVFQPRIGFTWELPEDFGDTTLTGGFARFSGGDPTVWFSNAYQNFGGAIGLGDTGNSTRCTAADLQVLQGGSFTGIPACVTADGQAQAQGNLGDVAATDPNFKPPSQDRFSLGIKHFTADTGVDFFDDWQVQVDFIYGKNRNAVDFVDLSIATTGATAPDGRPIYGAIDPLAAGCNVTLADDFRSYNGATPECFAGRGFGQNILLTNAASGQNGDNYSVSAQFAKTFDFSDTASLNFRAGYAFADANVGNAGGSSTAGSNFEEVTTSDFNNTRVANSRFTNRHNIVVAATFKEDFFEDLTTTLGVFFRARSGRPLSFVFDEDTSEDTFGSSDDEANSLLYIPTGPNDPLVDFSNIDSAAFFNFIEANGLSEFAGQIAPRNGFNQPWTADVDLRFQQELPGVGLTDKDQFLLFIDFENVLNFFDSGAGIQRFVNTSNNAEGIDVVAADIVNGQYVYNSFDPNAVNIDIDSGDTLWRINFGIKYKF